MIELLAVIAILAILLIIAIPSVIKMYNNAKVNTFVDEVQSVINTAEKQYMSDQMDSEGVPECYSNKTIEGVTCSELDLSGNKNLKYYIGFDKNTGKISKVIVNNGTNSVAVDDNTGNVEAASVTSNSVKSGEEYTEINADTIVEGESIPDPVSFATDSWATIQKAVIEGNTSKYEVGGNKMYSIRWIYNNK